MNRGARERTEARAVEFAAQQSARAGGGDHRGVVGAERERREDGEETVGARGGFDLAAQALVRRNATDDCESPEALAMERAPR
ncbi:MAG: hypothetical protein LUP91_12025, partial [Methylococcaceae bacterium]|nr:hypothetical protein [Methylococcaceae bacterium]